MSDLFSPLHTSLSDESANVVLGRVSSGRVAPLARQSRNPWINSKVLAGTSTIGE